MFHRPVASCADLFLTSLARHSNMILCSSHKSAQGRRNKISEGAECVASSSSSDSSEQVAVGSEHRQLVRIIDSYCSIFDLNFNSGSSSSSAGWDVALERSSRACLLMALPYTEGSCHRRNFDLGCHHVHLAKVHLSTAFFAETVHVCRPWP